MSPPDCKPTRVQWGPAENRTRPHNIRCQRVLERDRFVHFGVAPEYRKTDVRCVRPGEPLPTPLTVWITTATVTYGSRDEESAADLLAEAGSRVENLNPDAVEAELAAGGVILVDIREADEFETQRASRVPSTSRTGCWSPARTPRCRRTWRCSTRLRGWS